MDNTGGVIADDFSPTDQQKLLRSLVMSLFLYLSANDMAVCPPPVTACTLILPCFSNARTTAVLPKMVAKCRGFICPLNMFGFASSRQYPYTTGCVKGGDHPMDVHRNPTTGLQPPCCAKPIESRRLVGFVLLCFFGSAPPDSKTSTAVFHVHGEM